MSDMYMYLLAEDGRTPVLIDDEDDAVRVRRWGCGMKELRRTKGMRVALTEGLGRDGKYRVSTVFLGLDHSFSFGKDLPPVLFETMVFHADTGGRDYDCERYHTWEEAEAGHAAVVEKVLAGEFVVTEEDVEEYNQQMARFNRQMERARVVGWKAAMEEEDAEDEDPQPSVEGE